MFSQVLILTLLLATPLLAAEPGTIIAITGSAENTRAAAAELDLLHPAAVVGAGGAGVADVASYLLPDEPVAEITDHRVNAKEVAKRYRSAGVQAIHLCILDTEETATSGISNDQLAWLASDLNGVFNSRKCGHVVIVMHRPLWKTRESNWKIVQQLLVAFNRRPIVALEGMDDAPATQGPRVDTVIASAGSQSADDGMMEGIHYFVTGTGVGKLAGEIENLLPGVKPTYALLRVDDHGPHVAIVTVGSIFPPGQRVAPGVQAGKFWLTLVPEPRDLLRFSAWAPEPDFYVFPTQVSSKKP